MFWMHRGVPKSGHQYGPQLFSRHCCFTSVQSIFLSELKRYPFEEGLVEIPRFFSSYQIRAPGHQEIGRDTKYLSRLSKLIIPRNKCVERPRRPSVAPNSHSIHSPISQISKGPAEGGSSSRSENQGFQLSGAPTYWLRK
jgi:hypothetical protein